MVLPAAVGNRAGPCSEDMADHGLEVMPAKLPLLAPPKNQRGEDGASDDGSDWRGAGLVVEERKPGSGPLRPQGQLP